MSVEAMGWVLSSTDGMPATEKLILLGIANHANHDGSEAWPGIETLARYASVSVRQAQRLVRKLEADGWIEVERQGGGDARVRGDRRPNLYRILWKTPARGDAGVTPNGDGVTPSAPRGDMGVLDGVTQLCHPNRPRTVLNRPRPHGVTPVSPRGCGACDEGWVSLPDGAVARCAQCHPAA